MAKENNQAEGGGPSFHPELKKEKAPDNGASAKNVKNDGAILKKDQVPPL